MPHHPSPAIALHFKRFLDASPSITGAWVIAGDSSNLHPRVLVRRSQKDPTHGGVARRSLQTYVAVQTGGRYSFMAGGPPVPLAANVVHVCPSPSGKRIAYLKDGEEKSGQHPGSKAKAVCELYDLDSGALLREVVSEGLHGALVQDGFLSEGLTFSACENFIGYVAEALAPHSTCDKTFFHPLLPTTVASKGVGGGALTSAATAAPSNPGYLQEGLNQGKGASWEGGGREDWGEKYVGVRATQPFVVDFEKGVVCSVPVPEGVSAGQPIFVPTEAGGGVLYTGWGQAGERRLGLIHCFNRPHALFSAQWGVAGAGAVAGVAKQLTPYSLPTRSPRFNPSGSLVALLTMPSPITRMTHNGPSQLCVVPTGQLLSGELLLLLSPSADDGGLGLLVEGTEVNTPTLPADPWYVTGGEGGGKVEEGLLCPTARGIQGVVLRKVVTTGTSAPPPTPQPFYLGEHLIDETGVVGAECDVRYWGRGLYSTSSPICMERLSMVTVDRLIDCGIGRPSVRRECPPPSPLLEEAAAEGGVPPHRGGLQLLPTQDAGLKEERDLVAKALGAISYETLTVYPSRGSSSRSSAAAGSPTTTPSFSTPLQPSSDPAEEEPFHCTLIYPTGTTQEAPIPLIVVPHGGPHSGFTSAFSPHYAALASLGYGVLLVNYRGSTGYPLATLASLPGRCGVADVSDVFQATLTALAHCGWGAAKEGGLLDSRNDSGGGGGGGGGGGFPERTVGRHTPLPFLDGSRVGLCGGSHGGFLAAHLISNPATRPLYRTAVLRNPVTNIASMAGTTDIPDWCAVEALGCMGGTSPPSEGFDGEVLRRMFEVSPAALTRYLLPCAPTNPGWVGGDGGVVGEAAATSATATDLIAAGLIAPEKGGGGFSLGERAARVANLAHPVHTHPTPFMVMLGMKDRRVPPSQGLEWYHSVRRGYREGAGKGGRGGGHPSSNDIQLLIYPEDTHALDGGLTDGDAWVHLGCWLEDKVKGV